MNTPKPTRIAFVNDVWQICALWNDGVWRITDLQMVLRRWDAKVPNGSYARLLDERGLFGRVKTNGHHFYWDASEGLAQMETLDGQVSAVEFDLSPEVVLENSFADGDAGGDDDGMLPLWESFLCGLLGVCGCASLCEILNLVLADLRLLESKQGFEAICNDIQLEFRMHRYDKMGLVEHGTSVRGSWLTDKGRDFIACFKCDETTED